MSIVRRLRRLDDRVLRSWRQPGESAEDFLRRAAVQGLAMYQNVEVQAALQE